ncbi:MAG: Rpn family recombination-promoting nuclease/putative transposase [Cyanobacteria bacterium RI_101]|nr:Rpn family recombination-promoting nuclease/putative transposase [Cyanobacteria bacterium RI_101]
METDNLFYRVFLRAPQLISELIPQIPPDCQFQMSAPVVKGRKFSLDGLLSPLDDNPDYPLVFLEAQMQRDPNFYGRYFAEIFLYLYDHEITRPWYGLLILPSPTLYLGADQNYQPLLEQKVQRLYLQDLIPQDSLSSNLSLLKLVALDLEETIPFAQQLLQQTPDRDVFLRQLDVVEAILANKFPQLTPQEILKMLHIPTVGLRETRFYQEIAKEARQEGLQEGRQEGLQEGRQEGRQEGQVAVILRLLARKLGTLSPAQIAQIQQLSLPQLENLAETLFDLNQSQDLERWLNRHIV